MRIFHRCAVDLPHQLQWTFAPSHQCPWLHLSLLFTNEMFQLHTSETNIIFFTNEQNVCFSLETAFWCVISNPHLSVVTNIKVLHVCGRIMFPTSPPFSMRTYSVMSSGTIVGSSRKTSLPPSTMWIPPSLSVVVSNSRGKSRMMIVPLIGSCVIKVKNTVKYNTTKPVKLNLPVGLARCWDQNRAAGLDPHVDIEPSQQLWRLPRETTRLEPCWQILVYYCSNETCLSLYTKTANCVNATSASSEIRGWRSDLGKRPWRALDLECIIDANRQYTWQQLSLMFKQKCVEFLMRGFNSILVPV